MSARKAKAELRFDLPDGCLFEHVKQRDRYTTIARGFRSGSPTFVPAIRVSLIVPQSSPLGVALTKDAKKREARVHRATARHVKQMAKRRASRAKRSALSPSEKQQRNGTWKGHRE
jgi:hypothetical protein